MRIFTLVFCSTILFFQTAAAQQSKAQALTPAQQLVVNTGEEFSKFFSYGANHSKTVISGYGELYYQHNFDLNQSTADLKRAVLFVGHQFTGRIAFFSELEVEDAKVAAGGVTGEVGMEQAYLKFSLNPRQYIVAGLFLPRIGIINENHLPTNFNGVERPLVEQFVIPSTWREIGVGFYGQTTTVPLTYSVAVVNGLNNANFEHGTGFENGRAEGQFAGANNLAVTAAVQLFEGNWKFQVSGYVGGTTTLNPRAADSLQLESGIFGTPLYLVEGDIQYNNKGISFKALGCNVSLPDAASINRAYANNVPSQMYGAYAELGYNLLQTIKKDSWHGKMLNVFARYEMLDLNAQIPSTGVYDGTEKQSNIIAGLGYFPIPNVVIKADVRLLHTGPQNPDLLLNPNPNALPYNPNNTFLNIGIGYSFLTMNRKDFIKGSCGVCIALSSGFIVSAILDSCKTPLGVIKTTSAENTVTIPLTEFEKTGYKLVRVSNYDYDLAVQKMPDGTFETLVLMCTHAGQPLTKTGDSYYCTLHGSQFDHEGHVTKGPAEKDLMQLQTKIIKDHLSIQLKQTS